MSPLPRKSTGVLCAPLGDLWIVYDLVTETRHRVNASAAMVLNACDGVASRSDAIATWAANTNTDVAQVSDHVDEIIGRFTELGLVDRNVRWSPPPRSIGAKSLTAAPDALGTAHLLLDRTLQFRSSKPDLLARIDTYLGTGSSSSCASDVPPDAAMVFEVDRLNSGVVQLTTDAVTTYETIESLLSTLVPITAEYAAETDGCVALHAAGVRNSAGSIALLPAVSGSGKSSLAGAMIAAGWDYLGDDVVGIDFQGFGVGFPRRIDLDRTSRAVLGLPEECDSFVDPSEIRDDVLRLGGRAGLPTTIVFPDYVAGAETSIRTVEAIDSFDALLEQTINLARTGQSGLETLCSLVESSASYRLTYGDAIYAANTLTELLAATE